MEKVMLWYLLWTASAELVTSVYVDNETPRSKRANAENFDILLNIYKMNPLKESNVFKTFSNTILLPRPDERTPDLNFESNESTKEKRIRMRAKFKQIEDAIHVTQLSKTIVKRPSLNIQKRLSRKYLRHKGLPKNGLTRQNNLEINDYVLKNGADNEEKIENESDMNKNLSDFKFSDINIADKPVFNTDKLGFDKKVIANDIGYNNNGIAVLK